jgi:hypothetical protein
MSRKNKTVQKPIIVVVEGLDYLYFLLNRIKNDLVYDNVQLWDFKEESDLSKNLGLLRRERDFENVTSLGIIRDAEADRTATEQAVQDALRSNGFAVPTDQLRLSGGLPNTGYLIVPHDEASGCLEHACLKASTRAAQLPCVNTFYDCVRQHQSHAMNPNEQAKLKVHAHIAGSGLNPALTLGESSEANLWDFGNPSLEVLLRFIRLFP